MGDQIDLIPEPRPWWKAPDTEVEPPQFDGATYEAESDHTRLTTQMQRVAWVMQDGRWRTLEEIAVQCRLLWPGTCDTEAAVSARLRDFRKVKFAVVYGTQRLPKVRSRRRSDGDAGLWEYRVENVMVRHFDGNHSPGYTNTP